MMLYRRHTRRKINLKIYGFILSAMILYIAYNLFQQKNPNAGLVSPVKLNKNSASPLASQVVQSKSLEEAVNKALVGTKGNYGVVIKNLKTNESYVNESAHKSYDAGSLYKLWVMATVYQKIQSGEISEDDVLSEDVATLNQKFNIDPELAEQTEGAITLTVKSALTQMITISHNYAALLLTEKVKLSQVAKFLQDNNFNESKVGVNGESPVTTPADIALFFEKLYKGNFGNEIYTNEMIGLLKDQQLNDKLPKYLPDNTEIAHKTGEIDYFTHDAGIVYLPNKGDYIISVLSESESPTGAEDRISLISKAVYDYFSK